MTTEAEKKKTKSGRLIFRIVILLFLSIFIGTSVYALNARRVFHNAMPMPLGIGSSIVLSGSMEPTLSVNDLVLVHAQEAYEIGDVVVYQAGSSLIIHRIIEIRDEGFVTKGDANNTDDGVISPEAVKGRMILHIPYIGIAVHFLQSLPGAVLVIAFAAFLVNRSWSKERAEDDKSLDQLKEEIRRLKAQEETPEENPADGEPKTENPPKTETAHPEK